jgi:aminomethyltransferase
MSIPDGLRSTPFSPRYPDGLDEWIDVYGFAVPLWITDPESEYDAVRNRVGTIEYSMLYKWFVEGPGARAIVDATVSRDITALPVGRIAYGVVVSNQGTMIDDVTVTALRDDLLIVAGGNPHTGELLKAIAGDHSAAGSTVITERRDQLAVLSLQGPHSRDVLTALTTQDVSNEALPYYNVRQVELAGIPTTVSRLGFTAELGYELMVDEKDALALYDAVHSAGEPYGIQAFSAAALMMCRVEAGMVMGEIEYDHTISPYECRLGWTIDDKADFHGRDALLARKGTDHGRVVTIQIEGDPDGLDGATVHAGDAPLGIVTMAVPSPQLGGATIALARLHRDYSDVGTPVKISTPDGFRTAEVISTPVYDPERNRVRS